MRDLRSILAVMLLAVFSASSAFSQAVNGSLLGTVTDSSGASVPSAKVTLTETQTGVSRTTNTNESGNYTFADLPFGTYTVTAEHTGFKRASRAGVDVIVNTTARVDLSLQPGAITETVVVTAETPMLQTERADTGRTIERVYDLPLGGSHNFQSLTILVPGAALPEGQHSAFFNPQVSLATRFNGQSRLSDNLQLEGVDDNERTGLLQVLIPPQEAIQTVNVSTSNFEAELGRATGGVTNVILKSGTNQFTGEVYEFNRLSALAARNWYDATRSHFTYNYFGGTFGGPIRKNRTFFFGDYLRIEDHSANNDRLSLPLADMRTGNLNVAAPGKTPTVIYDPATGDQATGAGRTPFSGNIIPPNRINQVSTKILAVIPAPNNITASNSFAQNYFVNSPFYRNTDQFDVKVDHNQTDHDRFSVRYSFSRPVSYDASVYGIYGGPRGTGGSGFEGTGVQNTHSGAINYNHIFSPTFIAEVRAGVNRYRNDAQQAGYGLKTADALGIPGVNVSDWTSGPPQIALDNFGDPFIGFSASLPWVRSETNILLTSTWTKTHGNHTIKWGGEMRRVRDDLLQTQTVNPRGRYQFSTAQTSNKVDPTSFTNSFASFLLDVPNAAGRDFPVYFPAYRAWQFFAFVQDKWVVTPKLTLDLGLRWEFYPPATPAHTGGFSQFDPVADSLVIAGIGGNPLNLGLRKHWKDFGPRLGIAYRLNEKTVIRTGFGISFSPFPDNTYAYNYPIKQNNVFSQPSTCSTCGVVLSNGQPASFQNGFPPFNAVAIPSNGIITKPDPNQTYFFINPLFREPYVEAWNFAIQRALPSNLALEIAYVGNHGVAQPAVFNLNASTTLGANQPGQPLFAAYGQKASVEDRYVGYSSMYHSLQTKLDKRFSHGFSMVTSYTFSKAMGMQSEDAGLDFYINARRNWRRLDFNRTHTFAQSYVYQLPFGKGQQHLQSGPGSWLLGGWQVSGILTIYTGHPLTSFPGNSSVLGAPGNNNTENWFGPGPIPTPKGNGLTGIWFTNTICNFDPNKGALLVSQCFAQPGAENGGKPEFGNLGRNFMDGPGAWSLDGSVFRSFDIRERMKLQFRGEAFSAINTPRWNDPNTDITSSNFGKITGAGGARSMQFSVKLLF
jgi:Carboxypeptidase regulatory-like domain/TonB dependent receptor